MRISVIVVNWNRRDLLRACLLSLARQTASSFEIIVVDNGSTDGSAEMIIQEFQSVRLIRNPENRGFCVANNQGFAAAHGEFIALLNNDAEAEPLWLEALAKAFCGSAQVGMAASKILVYEDPTRIDKVGHLIYPDGQNRGRGTGERDYGQYDRQHETLWPDGCAAMYRKEMLQRIGGFDEDFFAYGDDAELGLRARIAGWQCVYVPDAVVRHRRGSTLGLKSALRLELIERNRVLLAVKLFPVSLLLLNPFYYAARLFANALASAQNRGEAAAFSGVRGKLLVIGALLRGDIQALRLLPRMIRKRRDLRHIRSLSSAQVRQLILGHRISLKELSTRTASS
jgi:GT2 family glycosyltransferase